MNALASLKRSVRRRLREAEERTCYLSPLTGTGDVRLMCGQCAADGAVMVQKRCAAGELALAMRWWGRRAFIYGFSVS